MVAPVPPFAIGNVPVMAATGKLLALVKSMAEGTPKFGVVKTGLVKVLLVKVSAPANVDKVPVTAGNVMVAEPETAGATIVAEPVLGDAPAKATLVAEAAPNVGVTNVGEVENTTVPVPVSLVSALAKFTLVGVFKNVPTFAPKLLMSEVPNVPQIGDADADPVPVCDKNFFVDEVFPAKNDVVFAAD